MEEQVKHAIKEYGVALLALVVCLTLWATRGQAQQQPAQQHPTQQTTAAEKPSGPAIPDGVAVVYSGGTPTIMGHDHLTPYLQFNCEGCEPFLAGARFAFQAAQQQARQPQIPEKE